MLHHCESRHGAGLDRMQIPSGAGKAPRKLALPESRQPMFGWPHEPSSGARVCNPQWLPILVLKPEPRICERSQAAGIFAPFLHHFCTRKSNPKPYQAALGRVSSKSQRIVREQLGSERGPRKAILGKEKVKFGKVLDALSTTYVNDDWNRQQQGKVLVMFCASAPDKNNSVASCSNEPASFLVVGCSSTGPGFRTGASFKNLNFGAF
jgi:hypothetical protein